MFVNKNVHAKLVIFCVGKLWAKWLWAKFCGQNSSHSRQKAVRAAGFRSCQDLCLRRQATYELAVRPGHCDCAADKSCVLTVLCRKAAPMVQPNSTTPEPAVLAKQAVLYTLLT